MLTHLCSFQPLCYTSASYNNNNTSCIGHWMGLFHTFQGGCEGGDLIGDTAPEKTEASGCDIGRGTFFLKNSRSISPLKSHFLEIHSC